MDGDASFVGPPKTYMSIIKHHAVSVVTIACKTSSPSAPIVIAEYIKV
jgi:hypothetical protein